MKGFSQDRQQAGQIWEQHLHTALRRRRAAARAVPKAIAALRKQTARKTAKKRKHARG
jgi:hypothetical protein